MKTTTVQVMKWKSDVESVARPAEDGTQRLFAIIWADWVTFGSCFDSFCRMINCTLRALEFQIQSQMTGEHGFLGWTTDPPSWGYYPNKGTMSVGRISRDLDFS